MSISIGDIKVPTEHCSPTIMLLGEHIKTLNDSIKALTDDHHEWVQSHIESERRRTNANANIRKNNAELTKANAKLNEENAKLKEQTENLLMTMIAQSPVESDLSKYELDRFLEEYIKKESGATCRLTDVVVIHRQWARLNPLIPSLSNPRHVLRALMLKHYGEPTFGRLTDGSYSQNTLTFSGCKINDETVMIS
jgi:hypothetical protein